MKDQNFIGYGGENYHDRYEKRKGINKTGAIKCKSRDFEGVNFQSR